jgi:hypothetical protein
MPREPVQQYIPGNAIETILCLQVEDSGQASLRLGRVSASQKPPEFMVIRPLHGSVGRAPPNSIRRPWNLDLPENLVS